MNLKTLSRSSIIRYLLLGILILPFYGCKDEDDPILYNDLESNIILRVREILISEIDGLEEFSYPDEGLSPFYYQLENPEEAYLLYFTYLQRSDLFDAGVLLESFRKTDSKGLTIISWDNYRF